MAGPLAGTRVLDLTQVLFGPYCTMLLADMGAEVIKIERPIVGDISRGNGPVVRGLSTYFLSLNRGKKSITIDLSKPRGVEVFLKLVETADILVQNYTVGTMEKLGLGYDRVTARNPRIIYAAGSGFGQFGPFANRPAFDVTIQAQGGVMSLTGEDGGRPLRPGASYGDIAAGLFLCTAVLGALHERQKSGQGQYIDISMLDCQVSIQENAFVRYLNTGELPHALGTRHPVFTPFQLFETRDSWVALALRGGLNDQWPLFCALIDRLDIIDDPRFRDGWSRTQHYNDLAPILNEALKAHTTDEWLEQFVAAGIACGPVNNIAQVASHPQVAARNMIVGIEHPTAGKFKVANSPFNFSRTPSGAAGSPPDLGQHTDEILTGLLGMKVAEVRRLKEAGIV